jgi:exodeoxyribonuclease VII small subunit
MAKETQGFEESLARLEQIVRELEGNEVPLEKALALFEEGMTLGRSCTSRLDEAEKRITVLLQQSDGTTAEVPFDPSASDAPPAQKSARRATTTPAVAKPRPRAVTSDEDIPF